jgi:hypothetical protein
MKIYIVGDVVWKLRRTGKKNLEKNKKMKNIYIILSCFLINIINLSAQTTAIEDINHRLSTLPYFELGLDYDAKIILPDSIKEKMVKALKRELPKQFVDSVFFFSEQDIEQIKKMAWQRCKNDTVCFKEEYEYISNSMIEYSKENYYNRCFSRSLILACGNWKITEAMPYLEKELRNITCKYLLLDIKLALAKLNDSIKQSLMEKYTLSYMLKNSQLDTINDNALIYELEWPWYTSEGMETAMYLKNKEMLLNILDLIYIKGISVFSIGLDDFYSPYVSFFVDEYSDYNYFHNFPNYNVLKKICNDYCSAIWNLSDKKLNKKEKKELEKLLSTEYRKKIKEQLQDWIIENVNFE